MTSLQELPSRFMAWPEKQDSIPAGSEQATELKKRSPDSIRRKYSPPPILCASNGQTMQHISQKRSYGYSFTMNKRKRTVHCCHPQYVAQIRVGCLSKTGDLALRMRIS